MKKKQSEYERFMALSDEQKAAAVAVFDKEDLSSGKPKSAAERRKFRAWQKKALGRPRIGKGFLRWNVSLEKSFAREIDQYVKTHGRTRSAVIAEALRAYTRQVA